jgi:GNAT superfamily N-acetyltransferase
MRCAGSGPPPGRPAVVDADPSLGPCRSRRGARGAIDASVFRSPDDRRAWIPPRLVPAALPFAIDHGIRR